jgi:hypothetical protein
MKSVPGKSCRENQKTHLMFNDFLKKKITPFWGKVLENLVDRGRAQTTTQHGACA